ncbi:MAG: hypothetical protein DMG34_17405 [Acidobacteria bacterium]|nr:MAG: hypothetical protein DMG34_17405 [Acidobacteriota bacterium]
MVVAVRVRGTVAPEDPPEYEAKARFLAITPEFVEWPHRLSRLPPHPCRFVFMAISYFAQASPNLRGTLQ